MICVKHMFDGWIMIVDFSGVCVDSTQTCWNLHMLVDFCDGGSLFRLILDLEDPFRWRQRCSLALDIAKGMEYVHGQGYMHRDLTSMVLLFIHITIAKIFKVAGYLWGVNPR